MATLKFHLRLKKGKERKYYYIRTRAKKNLGAGYNKDAAEKMLTHFTALEILRKNGVPIPKVSGWTMKDLRKYDLAAAAHEGKETDSRRRRWNMIVAFFPEELPIDDVTRDRVGLFMAKRREDGASIATIRRDLTVLRGALARARDPESGAEYEGDPFAGMPSHGRKEREARVRTPKFRPELVEAVIAAAWEEAREEPPYLSRDGQKTGEWRQNAEMIELVYLTKSRPEQIQELRRDQVRLHPNPAFGTILWFDGHKLGTERFFFYRGRIRELLEGIPDTGSEYFFPSIRAEGPRETPRRRFLQRAIRRAMTKLKTAGTPAPELLGMTLRSLRKSKACADLAAGRPPGEIQSELGHRSLSTTLTWYTEVFPHIGSADWPAIAVAPPVVREPPKPAEPPGSSGRKPRRFRRSTTGRARDLSS